MRNLEQHDAAAIKAASDRRTAIVQRIAMFACFVGAVIMAVTMAPLLGTEGLLIVGAVLGVMVYLMIQDWL